ncbi:MAG TPA: methyltransferase domain-containing protein [Candidatus Dormibacteraeota bacterium]|nr:methyltransferase domain-containing protein [Candidatus Dormibacteraeota bacterium]
MATLREMGIGEAALEALGRVARETFLPSEQRSRAYQDRALPIGLGQTCSQPWIVAVVVQALDLRPGASVLEVGAGSGYLAAVLRAAGAGKVIAVELIPQLAVRARRNLNRAGVSMVQVLVGDGRRGAPGHGTFDAVVVSAATREIPSALLNQVALPGKLIAPVMGPQGERLWCLTRGDRSWSRQDLGECRFVPLLGESDQAPTAASDPTEPRLS